jgi:hypothetical protein
MTHSVRHFAFLLALILTYSAFGADPETLLFDFKSSDLPTWEPVRLAALKPDAPTPAPKIELSAPNDSTGKSSLKITFAGGQWPTVGTTVIPIKGAWKEFQTLEADLTVDKAVVAYIGIGQGAQDAKALKPNWEKTLFLRPGRNSVALTIRHGLGRTVIDPKAGEITSFVIGMFQPEAGQVLQVENVRLSRDWPPPQITGWYSPYNHDGYSAWAAQDYERTGTVPPFKVLDTGTGAATEVPSYIELSKKLKESWKPPAEITIEQAEGDFRVNYEVLKKEHPHAVMVILRDGEKGFDPANPRSTYAGWKIAYLSCHGPDGPNAGRESAGAKYDTVEAFMRHRGLLMQADLSCIPRGSTVLAGRLVITRVVGNDFKPIRKANLWMTEPCNRDWDPDAANCYYYARGKLWKAVSGLYYGQDPDFFPILLSHGPGSAPVNVFYFAEGLKFWIDQGHENHGFFFYGDSGDYMRIYTQKCKNIRQRPAIMVIYEPKQAR